MCGIAGVFRLGPRPPDEGEQYTDRSLLERMLAAIAYRGPDDLGIESLGRLTFGVRRLAILDVAGGHQPLSDVSGRVWAAQNGEIYNYPALRDDLRTRHPLRTGTDTEVLPYLYLERGPDLFAALRGMFATAIYEPQAETLVLARDPLGVKPLYVAEVGDRLLFASEMKALLCEPALGREVDADALALYLSLGYVPGEATMLRSIRKLRPGCRLIATPRERRRERYVRWPRFCADESLASQSPRAWVDEAARRLADSIEAMLLSDRPLGVLLSGGLDSSTMVALLPEAMRRETRTFAIGFEGAGDHDERAYARRVAAHLGTRHQEFAVGLDLAAELPRVVTLLDEPCADPAAVPAHLIARAASSEVTVLLSGTGGDEVFGGYRRYHMGALLRRVGWLPRSLASLGARALSNLDNHRRTRRGQDVIMLRKLLDARSQTSFFASYLTAFAPATPARWNEALASPLDPAAAIGGLWSALVAEAGTPSGDEETSFTVDHLYYLPDDLLLKEDRTTMGASVEGRVPFLDLDLVEFAARLPLASRFNGLEGKQVLRAIARTRLPEDIVSRPKHGFSVPIEDWLRGPLDELVGDTFQGTGSGIFRGAQVRRWHDLHRRGVDRSGPLWAALTLELWWRQIATSTPEALAASGAPVAGGRPGIAR